MPGRPPIFNAEVAKKCIELFKEGWSYNDVGKIFGVSDEAVRQWTNRQEPLSWEMKEAKAIADELVETALFKKSIGYSHPETKVFCSNGEIVEHEVMKHYPPDTPAAIFWLKNRKPKEWKERVELQIGQAEEEELVSPDGTTVIDAK